MMLDRYGHLSRQVFCGRLLQTRCSKGTSALAARPRRPCHILYARLEVGWGGEDAKYALAVPLRFWQNLINVNAQRDNLQIPYGISDFKRIRNEGYYYVDKTGFIPELERAGSFLFFVRPRRFGKSLMASMLRCYYDVAEKDNFEKLFGGLEIATNPTANRNRYLVLYMDFSEVNRGAGLSLQERFDSYVGSSLTVFLSQYGDLYGADALAEIKKSEAPAMQFNLAVKFAKAKGLHLYLMLDEYDNFTNAMLRAEGNDSYRDITHGQGFYREWFKAFKTAFDRIYMTGVSPVTMDDLTSGFNIAANITQHPAFNSMLGFSEEECLRLYADFHGVGAYTEGEPAEWVAAIKPWYDGYCFASRKRGKESVFNSDMALFFLKSLVQTGEAPESWVDVNIRTDYAKLKVIADIQRRIDPAHAQDALPVTERIASDGEIQFELKESFPADSIPRPENFKSLFYYYGILSMKERREGLDWFRVPNVCVKQQVFDYLREHFDRANYPDWSEWSALASAFAYRGDWEPFLRRLAEDFAATNPVRGGIQGEHRIQGYMQAEFGHLNFYLMEPEMELSRGFCDFCLFPERHRFDDVKHSYLVELKYDKADVPRERLDAQYREAVEQLARYRADRTVPSLARGTTLHQLVFQFKGAELFRCEQIAEEPM